MAQAWHRFWVLSWLGVVALLALASACGDDSDGAEQEPTPTATTAPAEAPTVVPTPTAPPEPSPEPPPTEPPEPTPTSPPAPEPTEPPSPAAPEPAEPQVQCDPSYPDVCIPVGAADYDCAGGSGNGPNYIAGPIRVLPPDPHGLDRDGNGWGCE